MEVYRGKTEEEGRRGQGQKRISDEIRHIVVDRVVNHCLTMAEVCS